jgi:hypothetical protein
MQIIFLSISPKFISDQLQLSYKVNKYYNIRASRTGSTDALSQIAPKHPEASTSMLSRSTLMAYHSHTAVVMVFERQLLLSIPITRWDDVSSFSNALITVLP